MVITMCSGLVVDLQNPYLACSRDDIVPLFNDEQGLVQYKCPYKAAKDSLTLEQAALWLSDFCVILNSKGQLQLKRTACTCFNQIQGSLTGKLWCQFMLWTPQGAQIETIPVYPDFEETACRISLLFFLRGSSNYDKW